jgi:hypothetical protein
MLAIVREDRDALQRPTDESERRIQLMKETINEAERSMHELNFLFMAEQARISDLLLDRRQRFFGSAWAESEKEFANELLSVPRGFGPPYRRRLMHFAQEVARHKVLPWLKPEQEPGTCEAHRGVETALRRHTKSCPHRTRGRSVLKCNCPLWADGYVDGRRVLRQSLGTRDMARARKKAVAPESPDSRVFKSVAGAVTAFLDHRESEGLRFSPRVRHSRTWPTYSATVPASCRSTMRNGPLPGRRASMS